MQEFILYLEYCCVTETINSVWQKGSVVFLLLVFQLCLISFLFSQYQFVPQFSFFFSFFSFLCNFFILVLIKNKKDVERSLSFHDVSAKRKLTYQFFVLSCMPIVLQSLFLYILFFVSITLSFFLHVSFSPLFFHSDNQILVTRYFLFYIYSN